jgi:endonuclease/exonuclease/phosphatase family metal-dependent hydrolase
MSYNVHDLLDDAAAAARVVRAVDPDVLCLQEVPRRLTTELRLPAFARACRLWWAGGRTGTGGTAVLTALRVAVHGSVHGCLATRWPDRTRGYAGVDVRLPGRPEASGAVRVVSVHLGLDAAERVRHVEALLPVLTGRFVAAGDLNEGPDGQAYRLLATRSTLVSGAAPTFPVRAPRAAVDVVLASPGLAVADRADRDDLAHGDAAQGRPVESDVVAASDHLPVWVDLVTE